MTNEAGGASVASSATTGGKRLLLYKLHSRQDVFVGSLTPDGSRLSDVGRVTFRRASPAQWVVDDDGPADFATIQAAIEAFYVHTGDTILVKAGLHLGNVVLTSKDLVIRSGSLRDHPRRAGLRLRGVSDGPILRDAHRGLHHQGRQGPDGRGVWIYGGGPVVTRNVIVGNSAVGGFLGYGYDGGIEIYSSAAVITRNVVRGNTALDGGGGIDVYYAGPSTPGTCCR